MFGVDNTLLSLVGGKKFEVLLCALVLLLLGTVVLVLWMIGTLVKLANDCEIAGWGDVRIRNSSSKSIGHMFF